MILVGMEAINGKTQAKTRFKKVVVIGIRDLWCGVEMKYVNEVSSLLKITNVPWTPEYLLGVSNLRGNIISLVDTGMLLGRDPCVVKSTTRIVVCKSDGIQTGLLVDSMFEIADVDEAAIDTALTSQGTVRAEYISGEFEYNKRIVTVLNMPGIAEKLRTERCSI